MADYFTECCTEFTLSPPTIDIALCAEEALLDRWFLDDDGTVRHEDDVLHLALRAGYTNTIAVPALKVARLMVDWALDEGEEPDSCGFSLERPDESTILVRGDQSVNLEYAAQFLHSLLLVCESDECASLEYANTCSKMREGAFGGGAIFITKDQVVFMSTSEWLAEQRQAHTSARP